MKGKFSELIKSSTPTLVDFYADWCGPCKVMAPILKDVKQELGGNIVILKINVDKNQALASKYQVRSIPTLILFKNGTQQWREAGVVDKQKLLNKLAV